MLHIPIKEISSPFVILESVIKTEDRMVYLLENGRQNGLSTWKRKTEWSIYLKTEDRMVYLLENGRLNGLSTWKRNETEWSIYLAWNYNFLSKYQHNNSYKLIFK